MGVEPIPPGLEPGALPLSYVRVNGDRAGTRTQDLRLRRAALYLTELRGRKMASLPGFAPGSSL